MPSVYNSQNVTNTNLLQIILNSGSSHLRCVCGLISISLAVWIQICVICVCVVQPLRLRTPLEHEHTLIYTQLQDTT